MNIKLKSNKHVTISHVLYPFWRLLYETKLGLTIDRIMSNHYVYATEFCTWFRKKLLDSIDEPEYVYSNVVGWDTQISKIYGSSMECAIAIGVEVGDNTVGKLQRIF